MLNCLDATRMMSEAQERELSLGERTSLMLHVMMCSGCHNFNNQMTALRKMTRAYAKGENAYGKAAGNEKKLRGSNWDNKK